jgi:aminoglycoside phosphotransferase (APT) family kinase protein
MAALSMLDLGSSGLRPLNADQLNERTAAVFAADAKEYAERVSGEDETTDRLVRQRSELLAGTRVQSQRACLVHHDLCGSNIMVMGDQFSGIVDWDWASADAPERDLGVFVASLLVTLPVPESDRIALADSALRAYYGVLDAQLAEHWPDVSIFALDTLLDWLVGGKNAPRHELIWATSLVMNSLSQGGLRSAGTP